MTRPTRESANIGPLDEDEINSVLNEAERIFGDDIAEEPAIGQFPEWGDAPVLAPERKEPEPTPINRWRPAADDFTNLKGKQYLGARKRILWMRGPDPEPHPDWTIDTVCEEHIRGEWKGQGRVAGGYARYRANIFDAKGRLIATGTKTEYSENFADFAEKAETGSIARALAVAGYGTESALELDEGTPEGASEPRIADAPAPISITPSNVPGIRQGGRSESITTAQLQSIARLSRERALGPEGISHFLDDGTVAVGISGLDIEEQNRVVLDHLKTLSFAKAGELIQRLSAAS